MTMRKAKPEDIEALNALCFRSKAVWGYDDGFMEACREELSLEPAEIDTTEIAVIEAEEKTSAWRRLKPTEGKPS
jgi:hypothetical protein